jgi:hypothetical protein
MAETELNTQVVPRKASRWNTIERALKRFAPNPYSPARIDGPYRFLFVVAGNTVSAEPAGLRNWLVEDHASALQSPAIVLQDRVIDLSTPREQLPTFSNTFSFETFTVRAEAAAKFLPPSRSDLDASREIVREVFRNLDFEVSEARMREAGRRLEVRHRRARHTAGYFERVLDRVKPNVVFMQSASYGDRSHLISILKGRDIEVVEHQHGWIGPSHGAYNFGSAMWTPTLSRCLPDVLLTFGEFWSDQVRTPSRLVAIGKPHLERMAAEAPPISDRAKAVVVVSSMYEPEETARLTLQARDVLPDDWQVIFRPHPTERPAINERFPSLKGEPRIVIDEARDVFDTLARVRGVIGYASTVLYEALALGCEVFVRESPLADLYTDREVFGERIVDRASLDRAMRSLVDGGTVRRRQLESIWAPESTSRFIEFVDGFDRSN